MEKQYLQRTAEVMSGESFRSLQMILYFKGKTYRLWAQDGRPAAYLCYSGETESQFGQSISLSPSKTGTLSSRYAQRLFWYWQVWPGEEPLHCEWGVPIPHQVGPGRSAKRQLPGGIAVLNWFALLMKHTAMPSDYLPSHMGRKAWAVEAAFWY